MLKKYYPSESNCQTAIPNYNTTTIVDKFKEKYKEVWKHKMTNSSTLSFLCAFKNEYKMAQYLTTIKNLNILKAFTQFSVSKLQIEQGRYKNIPHEQRTCKLCDCGEIEDEFHFMFKCKKFDHLRENSNNVLKTIFKLNTTDESKRRLLQHTMSSEDPVAITPFASLFLTVLTKEKMVSNPAKLALPKNESSLSILYTPILTTYCSDCKYVLFFTFKLYFCSL